MNSLFQLRVATHVSGSEKRNIFHTFVHRDIMMDPENNNKMADAYQTQESYRIIEWRNNI